MEPREPDARDPDPAEADAPDSLIRTLRALGLEASGTPLPDAEPFLAEVRSRFAAAARRRRQRTFAAWSSAAAALLLVWAGWRWPTSSRSGAGGSADAARATTEVGDLDRNGRIDILDAFALARAIERDGTAGLDGAAADLSGDRRVDRADVDAIARRAVALDRRVGR